MKTVAMPQTAAPSKAPTISVIVPVYNSPDELRECLASLQRSDYHSCEIIVVDDASTDETPEVAEAFGATVLRLDRNTGPAGARNRGAAVARGTYLLFVDADVCIHTDTVRQVADTFDGDSNLDAMFGSYDLCPRKRNILSQYKNLFHHFVHQESSEEASTFWAGCGAVRKSVFLDMGGFDTSYAHPCIEDIELGVRLYKGGHRIKLCKDIQATHLKKWTLCGLIKTDFFSRGIPWTELMMREKNMPNDLNLTLSQRLCAVMALGLVITLLVGAWFRPELLLLPLIGFASLQLIDAWSLKKRIPTSFRILAVAAVLAILGAIVAYFRAWTLIPMALLLGIVLSNRRFYAFFAREKGILFAAMIVPLHIIYYLYSGTAFVVGVGLHFWKRMKPRRVISGTPAGGG